METERWCYTCHSSDDIDKLRLPNGNLIAFDDSSTLCGACHGEKHGDWEANIHGLTTGYWNGPKEKRACTACHSPHEPTFEHMKPLAPPNRPRTVSATAANNEDHHP
jgi:formate-dependent nitrite reductase cytochrome c552 subunit